ncbi:MAG: metallophosphatase family protein [Pirellulales bacterium]|nr:metallophosphatase family protein [Pirellulales bacterium]
MLLGVVSDSHGHVGNTRQAVRMLQSLDVAAVIHCGDIGTPEIVELFAPWPTRFVFGNCDDARAELAAAIERAGQTCAGVFDAFELGQRRIAFTHSDDRRLWLDAVRSGAHELVCYGHTHAAEWHDEGPTRVLNPGALYRANPRSLAVVDLTTLTPTIVPL